MKPWRHFYLACIGIFLLNLGGSMCWNIENGRFKPDIAVYVFWENLSLFGMVLGALNMISMAKHGYKTIHESSQTLEEPSINPFVLCVGCGNRPEGNVNVDLYPRDPSRCGVASNPKTIENFVKADAAFLPFKDKAFSNVVARHVLEHVFNPLETLKEWKRVSGTIEIYVPSQYIDDLSTTHYYAWNPFTLRNLMLQVFQYCDVGYTRKLYNVLDEKTIKTIGVNLVSRLFGFHTEIKAVGSNL